MERLHFSIHIKASRERIWKVLWQSPTYPLWTRPFGADGCALSDWKQGSHAHFLAANGDGIFALIERVEENAFIGFKHLGLVRHGKELPPDMAMRDWTGTAEEFTLSDGAEGTTLTVEMDVLEHHRATFEKTFPEALALVKALSEQQDIPSPDVDKTVPGIRA